MWFGEGSVLRVHTYQRILEEPVRDKTVVWVIRSIFTQPWEIQGHVVCDISLSLPLPFLMLQDKVSVCSACIPAIYSEMGSLIPAIKCPMLQPS